MKNSNAENENAYLRVRAAFSRMLGTFGMRDKFKSGVLIGLSGGADSVMLLHLMKETADKDGFYLKALHVNHMIRGIDADNDEELCNNTCKKLGIPFVSKRIDVPKIAKEQSIGLEECARKIRYTLFNEEIEKDPNLKVIVTAHNSSDNAETVIFNMLRGGGSKAMCGIPAVRDNILRPLLLSVKSDISLSCDFLGYKYSVDKTNSDTSYTRNFIRGEIIPQMRKIIPSPEDSIARMCQNISCDCDFLDFYTDSLMKSNNIGKSVSREFLKSLHKSILFRLLVRMWKNIFDGDDMPLEKAHFDKILELIYGKRVNFSYDILGGVSFFCERGYCSFIIKEETKPYLIDLQIGKNTIYDGMDLWLLTENNVELIQNIKNIYNLVIQATLCFDKIDVQLMCRTKNDGDSYVFGQMTHKVKKLFNDKKIPISLREKYPIVCDDKGIVWVPGFGVRDDRKKDNIYKLYAYFCVRGGKNE